MSTRKFAISSLILGAAMFFSLGAPWPLSAQTSETSATASESSESKPPSKTKDAGKAKYAEGSYSADQVPDYDVPAKPEELRILRAQNARLKAENAQLKAEIAKLKASK